MIRPQTVSRYASMVKFSHTIFAMPFALVGYAYALQTTDAEFSLLLLVKVLLAMVFARNTAMGFNRYADRRIDALNPRTRNREIPAGIITPRRALIFVIVNAALFLAVALWINRLAFFLAPAALLVLVGYSFTKRFTAWCHIVLGVALGIAPVGAYIAVTGEIAVFPVLLTGLVNPQVIRTCEVVDIHAIVFVRGKVPAQELIDIATSAGITLLCTEYSLYTSCGLLYQQGLLGEEIGHDFSL